MYSKQVIVSVILICAVQVLAQQPSSITGPKLQSPTNRVISPRPFTLQPPGAAAKKDSALAAIIRTAESVPNDPFKTKIYTLANGLKIYISVNKDVPRVQTMIAVKAGSKFDPPQTTGLAHYLEHMMFKGSHDFGTRDWPHEKVLLDSISAYFEYHRKETDEAKKKILYAKIDSFSFEASKYAIPNEYDKMMSSLGAQGTNAFTSTDMTVFVNDIPSNGIEKFLRLESDRFQTCVLRLFHTELETVYEEFNRNQDNDRVWSDHAIDNALLPNHPYGTQTTIGRGEDLKNPSMVNIYNYFSTYYRPDNVAIILAGNIDPDATVAMINKYFGNWQPALIPAFVKKPEPEIKEPVVREYKGPQPEHVYLGFLFDGANSHDAMMVKLIDEILANGQAGLIDLDLVQQQKILNGYSYPDENTDYVIHKFYGEPKQGQTLEQVKDLLLAEIEKVKIGEFGDWLLPAIIQNLKLRRMQQTEKNEERAGEMMESFVHNVPWKDWVDEITEMQKITKEEVVKFAREHYKSNYAISYKRQGEATVHKVDKPDITPLQMDKESISAFKRSWDSMPQPPIQPRFLDFDKDIQHAGLKNGALTFDYIKNEENGLFSLNYLFDMGTDNIRELGLAVNYLDYLGTDKHSAEELKTEFYKLGLSFSVNSGRDRASISLSGLEENMAKGIKLFEELLTSAKPDKEVYKNLVMDIEQERENAKKNKNTVLFSGLFNYAKYGSVNPFNYVLTEDELNKVDVNRLTDIIKSLSGYKHRLFYYGSQNIFAVSDVLTKEHRINEPLKDYPAAKKYPELPLNQTQVFYTYYPMKQAEIVMLGKDQLFNKELYPYLYMYNEYYGAGLSSIMFQEVREKKALAYSVYSSFGVPQYANESHYVFSYIGTQADKLKDALDEMNTLLNAMPEVPAQFEDSRQNVIKTLESDWITKADIYAAYDRARRRGLNYDVRKEIYEKAKTLSLAEVHKFFDEHVKGKKYTYLVIGKKEDLNLDVLKTLGPVQELDYKTIFGY